MDKQTKLDAMVEALQSVVRKHNVIVDKYVKEDGSTKYYFKLQFEDVEVNLEEVFAVVYHGPPKSN